MKNTPKPIEFIYKMDRQNITERHTLEKPPNERDLCIRLTNDLKWCTRVKNAANKANSVLRKLRKTFMNWTKETTKKLYATFVRHHLEYAASVWNS